MQRCVDSALPLGSWLAHREPQPADAPRAVEDHVFDLVYRQMWSLTAGGQGDFDDLVQIAAERALGSLHRFEGRSGLSTWTYRICYTTLLKERRWHSRWLRRFGLTRDGELPERADAFPSAPELLEEEERRGRVRAAIEALSPKRRAVVVLHDLDGLRVEEISEIVDAKVATVRTRLRDGRARLAQLLADDPYFGDRACERESE